MCRRVFVAVVTATAIILSCTREYDPSGDSVSHAAEEEAVVSGDKVAISFYDPDMDETKIPGGLVLPSTFGVFACDSRTGEEIMFDQRVARGKYGYTYSPVKYFPDGGLDFSAYAPYGDSSVSFSRQSGGVPSLFSFFLPEDLSEDVLLSSPLSGVVSSDAPVKLSFQHPLTRISISFGFHNGSLNIPSGKGARVTSVSLSHCKRTGTYDNEAGEWIRTGEFTQASQECSVLVAKGLVVDVCSFYSVPFTAPEGAALHIVWEAFNTDTMIATRRYTVDIDLSGRDFSISQNLTAKVRAFWLNDTIQFEDDEAEAACVAAFDTDGDGALSFLEAESVTDLGDAFRGNDRITLFNEFRYFTGLTHMEGYHAGSFAYMAALREITLPPNLTYTEEWPFCKCPSLEKISVDESNPDYYSVDGCLYRRSSATLVRVPESVPIDRFVIPDGIRAIGYGCFQSNTTINSLQIGKDVVTICSEALLISNLSRITVAPGSTTYYAPPSILYSINEAGDPVSLILIAPKGGIYSLTLPDTVTSIGGFAIIKNSEMREITLNEGLESIGMFAFNGVDLGDLVIPSTVKYIGKCALRYTTLSSLKVLAADPPEMGEDALPLDLDDRDSYFPIYVPASSYQRYRQAPVWGSYSRLYSFI